MSMQSARKQAGRITDKPQQVMQRGLETGDAGGGAG